MGGKKGNKPLQGPPEAKKKKALTTATAESGELSAIASTSFIEGLQKNDGAVLHSTALEENLSTAEDDQEIQPKKKEEEKKTKKHQTANREGKENRKKLKSTPQKTKKTGPGVKGADGKKAPKRKSSGNIDAARPAKKQKVNSKKKPSTGSESVPQSQEELDGSSPHRHRDVFSSDEDVGDSSWKPSPKRPQLKGLGLTRTSSSGSGSQAEKGRKKKSTHKRTGNTELDVVMEEFMNFCQQYKETVESKAVRQAIDHFSSSVEDQLTEKIASSKNLKSAMRESSKVASAIRTKRQRLLDAKYELIKAERKLCLLQKDQSQLKEKLEDLSQGRTFLQNIRELNQRYLQHRQKHPKEKETYGATSLPALLIEAKHIQTAEYQLKRINDRLQKKSERQEKI